jgi:prepilin-type N-terminal cleavage/methylation domain-containing protein
MKKGFTLLELLIVIIIIGVLAVIALTQYKNLTERARSSEAKSIFSGVRTAEKVVFEDMSTFTGDWDRLGEIIATPPTAACNVTNWFRYSLDNATCPAGGAQPCFQVIATRCTSGGKTPDNAVEYNVELREDNAGVQNRTTDVTGVVRGW